MVKTENIVETSIFKMFVCIVLLTPKVLELINLSLWMTPEEILVTIGHSAMIRCYPMMRSDIGS